MHARKMAKMVGEKFDKRPPPKISKFHFNGFKEAIESSIIVSVGTFMHFNCISIIELNYTTTPGLKPNCASTLFIFSILCTFAKLRLLYPKKFPFIRRFLFFIVEFILILYAADIMMRQFWLPCLRLLNYVCRFLGQYLRVFNDNFSYNSVPLISTWMRYEGFYLLRFSLAMLFFLVMLDVTGAMDKGIALFNKNKLNQNYGLNMLVDNMGNDNALRLDNLSNLDDDLDEDDLDDDEDDYSSQLSEASDVFDINELPYTPQINLLNPSHRVRSRRRGKNYNVGKLGGRVHLGGNSKEYYC